MIAALPTALAKRDRIAVFIGLKHAKAAEFKAAADAADREAEALNQTALNREAAQLMDGNPVAPDATKGDERQQAEARRQAKVSRCAAEKVAAELPALQQQHADADAAVTDATLTYFREARDAAVAGIVEANAGSIPFFAELAAVDSVREALIGSRYSFDATRHNPRDLWSGEHVARQFVSAIPSRLRPEGFAEAVERRARERAAEILSELKEGKA